MDTLVSTDWLAKHLDAPDIVVIDASLHLPAAQRDAQAEFAKGHIPGARFLDLASLKDPDSSVPMAMPTHSQLHARLQELGVSDESRIVFYDDSAIRSAARAWFLAREFGYPDCAILDGGLAKWVSEGRPLSRAKGRWKPGLITRMGAHGRIRNKASMLANIDSRAEQVVDARDEGRFTGAVEDTVHNLPGGHIPGARNLPFDTLFGKDGTLLSKRTLQQRFRQAGISLDEPVVASCGSGITACTLLFALHRLGHDKTALYDGSWLEWASDPETPKQTGPAS